MFSSIYCVFLQCIKRVNSIIIYLPSQTDKYLVMNKNTLIEIISAKTGCQREDVATIIDSTLDTITETLKSNEPVKLRGFGTWLSTPSSERCIYDFTQRQKISITPRTRITFKPGRNMRTNDCFKEKITTTKS